MILIHKINYTFVFCFFCFFQAVSSKGQPVFFDVQSAKALYQDESFVLLNRKDVYTIKIEADTLNIVRTRKEQYLYLKKMSALGSERSISSSSFVPLITHHAYMYQPRGRGYSREDVPAPKKRTNTESNIFSDDQIEYIYQFSGIEAGTVIELESTHQILEPRFLPATFFQSTIPVYKFDCDIYYQDGIDLGLLPFNMDSIVPERSYGKRQKMNLIHYSLQNIDAIVSERGQLPLRYFIPHIIPVIGSYTTATGENIPILRSVDDLYRWYYSFIDSINPPFVTESLQPLTDSLTSGLKTDREKANAIYKWVQTSINYIAFESGMDGLVPRSADEVYRKRYGDCKDKTSLLHVLLSNAGFQSYICWVGTDALPYRYDQVPTPATDNHMIVALELDDNVYFLDATGKYQNIGRPTDFIQGKEALAAVDSANYKIFQIPEMSADQNMITDSVAFTLSPSGKLDGTGSLQLTGYPKQSIQLSLVGHDANTQKTSLANYLQLGNNTCLLNSYSIQGLDSYDTVLTAQYQISIDNYARTVGDECYINLNLYRDWEVYDIDQNRISSLYLMYQSKYANVFTLHIPAGFMAQDIPSDASYHHPLFGFETHYVVSGETVTYEHHIWINSRIITTDVFPQWREFMSELKKSYRQAIVLKKN